MSEIGKTLLDSGWLAARSTEVNEDGKQLTTTNPASLGSQSKWMEAAVPGTVLGTLAKNKAIPDPFYGLNNETIIDIADSGRDYYTFWFFTKFQCKRLLNQYVHLNFRAINYSAEVYVNGHKTALPKGMFRRHTLDVTDILHPENDNLLAVIVHPPDHPGTIPLKGGQGGDHEIGKDVAAQYVEGWDWICPIRDRNTGIWDEVSISVTGPVRIIDPHLVSTFFDNYKRVYLHVTAEFENKSTWKADCSVTIQITTELENGVCLVEILHTESVIIPARGVVQHTFKPLFFYKPELWWPNGMGKQSLYDVLISVVVKEFGESDSWMQPFGFRKVESVIDSVTGGRLFKINGEPIFIRGGNWILSDGLLRLSKERYRTDIKFHADMNMNMIRCWGGGLAERPEFYHYCDIYGLLVWQEFWITGDVDGRGVPVSNPNGPLDHDLFLLCARDTVKLLRNHPSLALWVGGNEQVPPKDINEALNQDLRLHPSFETPSLPDWDSDPSVYLDGARVYIQGSMWDGFADGKGNFTDGPYEIQYPEDFFKDTFYKFGFNPEVGSVGMPVADTIRATMPREGWGHGGSSKRVIKILGVPCDAVSVFIRFLYSPSLTEEEMESYGIHLLALSHVYMVTHLKQRCTKGVGERVTVENVVDVLQLARLCDAPGLCLKCMRLIHSKFKTVEQTEGWKFLQENDPFLELDILQFIDDAESRKKRRRRHRREQNLYMQLSEAMECIEHICTEGCTLVGPSSNLDNNKLKTGPCSAFSTCYGLQLLIRHFAVCKKRVDGKGCIRCKRMIQLLRLHSSICDQSESCRVPLCRQFKQRGEKDKKMVEDTKWNVLVRRVASAKAMSSLSQSKKKKSEVLLKEEAEDFIRIRKTKFF